MRSLILQRGIATTNELVANAKLWLSEGHSESVREVRVQQQAYSDRMEQDICNDPTPAGLPLDAFAETLVGQLFFWICSKWRKEKDETWEPVLPKLAPDDCSVVMAHYCADNKAQVTESLATGLKRDGVDSKVTDLVRGVFGDYTMRQPSLS